MKSIKKNPSKRYFFLLSPVIILCVFFLAASGCVSQPQSGSQSQNSTGNITSPNGIAVTVPVATLSTTAPQPVTTSVSANATTPPSNREIYYGNIAIFMDREAYVLLPFEDIGVPYMMPGERYTIRVTSDHAIFVYVMNSYQVSLLQTKDGVPVYDSYARSYDYRGLMPIFSMDNIYEDGGTFTVKQPGKYTLVLDTRLSEKDYRVYNEVTKVAVRILRVE